jgi:acetyl esterase/lipase
MCVPGRASNPRHIMPPNLFLIEPPPEVAHCPVKPNHIVVSGDSARGGLAFAFQQVIRDSGLPPPVGGLLVSHSCDLHHSFPGILLNNDTGRYPLPYLELSTERS